GRDVRAEGGCARGSGADLLRVRREIDTGEGPRAPHALEERDVLALRQAPGDAGTVGQTHLLAVQGRMLRLLGVGALQQVPRGAAIPEVSAEERARRVVELEYREIRGIRVSLRCPLPGAEMVRSRIRRHGEVHGRSRTAEPRLGPVARGACNVRPTGEVHDE